MPGKDPSRVLLSGATGLIGGRLTGSLTADGVAVRALSRRPERAGEQDSRGVENVGWDGLRVSAELLAGCDAVVHLSGEPVFGGRLSPARRRQILTSRVESTRSFVEALAALAPEARPEVFAVASAVGYYGSRGDEPLDEGAASGDGFLAEVCRQWEEAARAAQAHGTRVVSLRFGIVLAREGGALALMALPFRLGLGGRLGDGRQWVPWVHVDDAVGLIRAALRDPAYRGPVNVVAPQPVRNAELTSALGRVLRRPTLLPVPSAALRLALGELSDELLGSRRVVPGVASERGFDFRYTELEAALAAELSS